jgi:hypothetical protein
MNGFQNGHQHPHPPMNGQKPAPSSSQPHHQHPQAGHTMLERADSFGGRSSSFAPPMYSSYSDLYRMRNQHVTNNGSNGFAASPMTMSMTAVVGDPAGRGHNNHQLMSSLPPAAAAGHHQGTTAVRDFRRHGSIDIDKTIAAQQQQQGEQRGQESHGQHQQSQSQSNFVISTNGTSKNTTIV